LREDAGDLDAAGGEGGDMGGELTKLAAAVRSPGPSMKVEQQAAAREEVRERPDVALLIRDGEARGAGQRRGMH
jgi:hypothetical protein